MNKFLTLQYLKSGNTRQQNTFQLISQYKIWEILQDYQPLLAGTIPLGIDTPQSDLDILCEVYDFAYFEAHILQAFGDYPQFHIQIGTAQEQEFLCASFQIQAFTLEIFAQACPSQQQWAFRHMLIEAQLLAIGGEPLAKKIRSLKKQGIKTEPAFAQVLQLSGDPYQALLDLESYSLEALKRMIEKN